ncbi:hypothetical protein [Streptomyces purpureus]|uniref:Uncharacterized protein n=1 Tax=Streptomyces purpureus TaxID=1951 RepID=A0A918LRM0_9ACTN|nr:hypothetical protein [Streptomyces purpureus]GGT43324.1 hypothetical protein GCM10014713_41230 [Streptomyces purpureus]
MPLLAGQRLKAGQLDRLRPRRYSAVGTSTVAGPLTNGDIPGCTITLTTETANAEYHIIGVFDIRATLGSAGTATGRAAIDGAMQSPLATFNAPDASGRNTVAQQWTGTIPTAGSHTIKLVATLTNSTQEAVGVNSSVVVIIQEVV